MMSLKEIQAVASALGNQIGAGVPTLAACQRMARFQPRYAEFWDEVAGGVAAGRPLSEFIGTQWPETFVSALKAGEESGSVPAVLARIDSIIELQLEMKKLMMELAYPVGFGVLGVGVFVFFMLQVIPALSTSLGVGQHGMVFQLSAWMRSTVDQHAIGVILGLVGSVAGVVYWFSVPANRTKVVEFVLGIPVLGEALKTLMFSIWANYMALMAGAGIPVLDGLLMTSKTLPTSLRSGIELLAAEAVSRGMADAADPEKQTPGDSRREWPFYVANAFLIAQETGLLDTELVRAANAMMKEGSMRLKIALKVANVAALAVSAFLIVGPVAAYYIQLGVSLAEAMKG